MDPSEVVERLASRKGTTEADIQSDVRALLLYGGLDLEEKDLNIVLEAQVGGGGRIDVETGTTAIEVKRDLSNREAKAKAVEQLAGYVEKRTAESGMRYAGILTDGVLWELYYLSAGEAMVVNTLQLSGDESDTAALTVWVEGVMATAQGITPTPTEIQQRLGAESSSFALDHADLQAIYEEHKADPEVALKRELWARLLASALGTHFQDTDELFVLHTYLVVSAELIAHTTVSLPIIGQEPRALLSGQVFRDHELGGVVEPDFFDWPAEVEGGARFVEALAKRIARFNWSDVDHDVLKTLYESVIDTETRKQLGEYYTADWLAEGIVESTVDEPLEQRILDPACGSGTFLFWAVRRYLEAAEADERSAKECITGLVDHVAGIDLHPVAVALARVTYLLAIGTERLQKDRPSFSVPVYLGDSLRWEQDETLLSAGGIRIETTAQADPKAREIFLPERVVADVGRFDQLVTVMATKASEREPGSAVPSLAADIKRLEIHEEDVETITAAFEAFCELYDEGRDYIWGYYVRNLARPLWFTQEDNQVDVLVGNPPWLAYRFMSKPMQEAYRNLSEARALWAGGHVGTQQDLSDLFVVRTIEQYLRAGGKFGFVMPASVLSRRQFDGFRDARYEALGVKTTVAFDKPWDLRGVDPDLFPVPSSVVFGQIAPPEELPSEVIAFAGRIAHRGTRWAEAGEKLTQAEMVIERGSDDAASPYDERFHNGATIFPRVLFAVRVLPPGPIGVPSGTRPVESLRGALQKKPWKSVKSLDGFVEEQFIHSSYFGVNLVPFRMRDPVDVVLPWADGTVLEGTDPAIEEYPHLAKWWRSAEKLWEKHRTEKTSNSLAEQLDYYGKLSSQFPLRQHRVLYTKSGNRIAAARIDGGPQVIDHTLYWAAAESVEEGQYLVSVLNSAAVHEKLEPLMSEGQFGKRHADKYVFAIAFPLFDPANELHTKLAATGARAEAVANECDLSDAGFVKGRREVRAAIDDNGVGAEIEELVGELIAPVDVAVET